MIENSLFGMKCPDIEASAPTSYRLAKRGGELILQGKFYYCRNESGGYEWRDIPTVDLDIQE